MYFKSEKYTKFLNFKLISEDKEQIFCLDINEDIIEVLRVKTIRQLPKMPDFIQGIYSFRDNIISVINLKARLGLTKEKEPNLEEGLVIVVTSPNDKITALLIDEIADLIEIPKSEIEDSSTVTAIDKRFIKGIIKYNDDISFILDVKNVLTAIEVSTLSDDEDRSEFDDVEFETVIKS